MILLTIMDMTGRQDNHLWKTNANEITVLRAVYSIEETLEMQVAVVTVH